MKDADKTKEQLIPELVELRKQLAELKDSESKSSMELSKSEARYRQLVENPLVAVWQADTQGRFVFINKRLADMSGYSQDEVIGMSMMVPIAPELRPWLAERLQKRKGANFLPDVVEAEMIRKDRSRYTALVAPARLYDAKGKFIGFIGSMIDISDRKRAEESLQKAHNELERLVDEKTAELSKTIKLLKGEISKRKQTKEKLEHQKKHLESLFKYSSLAIVTLDEKQTIISCNRDFEKLFQFEESEIVGKNLDELITGQQYIKDAVSYTKETLEGKAIHGYGERKKKDGTNIYVEIFGVPVVIDGKLVGAYGIYQDISERKQAEERLRESEERYRSIVEYSHDGILIVDESYRFTYVNEELCRILGRSAKEIIGQDFRKFLDDESRELVSTRYILRQKGEQTPPRYEFNVVRKNGEKRRVEISSTVIKDSANNLKTVAQLLDITERKQAEDLFRTLFDRSPVGLFIIQDRKFQLINPQFLELTGYKEDEFIGKDSLTFILPEDRNIVRENTIEMLTGKLTLPFELRVINKTGETRWIEQTITSIHYNGRSAVLGYYVDISESKLVEQELRKSEERYRMLFKQSPLGIMHFDQKGVIVDCNEKFIEIMGSPREKLIGFDMLKSLRDKKMLSAIKTALSGGTGYYEGDYLSVTGGKLTPMRAIYNRITSEDGSFLGGVSLYEDITERKRAEEELRDSEERLKTILDSIQAGIVCINAETHTIVDANPAAIEMIGAPKEQIIGHVCHKYICPAERGKCPITDFGQEVEQAERTLLTANGKEIPILKTATPILLSGQAHLLDIFIDITEKKGLEAQLQQAQKMEAIGTLAGGIAHDFNNILQAIFGYTEILLIGKGADNPDHEKLEAIETSAQRASDLTKQLLIFSRKVESKLRPMDLNKETEQVSKILERTIPKMINIELHLAENLNIINADPAQIEQILMNLGVNARDAMPNGGRLIFETEDIILDEHYCKIHLGSKPGHYVKLSISDTGHGMDKETLKHIFDPFYTTKEIGKGTGLGLAMVYGIVKSHNGYIMCYSEPDEGTIFKIYFPVIEKETERVEPKEEKFPIKGGNETILLVDDEEAIRELGKDIITRFGYTVLIASDGETALEIYRENKKEISLVILDIIMPGMGGRKCLEELLKINPELRIIIASGYSMNGPSKEVIKAGAKGFISKPYNINQILKAVRETLDN
ncbi:MAG: PAS domain S-box protein [Deltaproteobacteria bacterium]|nr:PAS domain S-box protein [Deltaproteobacteria bacterium]